jgi:WD40 repeat protein
VNAATFHPDHQYLFTSVGGDGHLCLWDARVDGRSWERSAKKCGHEKPVFQVLAHKGGASSVSFAPLVSSFLATGGKDRMVRIWDLRQPHQALEGLAGHHLDVLSVDWAREQPGLLASSSADKRVMIWDPLRTGRKVDEKLVDRWHLWAPGKSEPSRSAAYTNVAKVEKGTHRAPELAMIHVAHGDAVTSLAWGSGQEGNLIASADASGFVHIWQPSGKLLEEGEFLAGDFGSGGRSLWGCFNG